MCLILFAYQAHPEYPLIVAANRDEFYDRPTARVAWWAEERGLLAGKDLLAGGTWMGVHRAGRFAAITNYREPGKVIAGAPSRGDLVASYLAEGGEPAAYLRDLSARGGQYNGFNLLTGDENRLYYYSNRAGASQALAPGLYGLSNHLLNTPWPKIQKGKTRLAQVLAGPFSAEDLFDLLRDRDTAPDHQLPDTGVTMEWERMLSAMFIQSPVYGTRVSSVLMRDRAGEVYFEERAYVPEGEPLAVRFSLRMTDANNPLI